MTDNPYRVKLVSRNPQPPFGYNKVTFEVSPDLVESRTVNYSSQDPVHMPGQIYVYKNTQARTFSVSGAKLISRTPDEAENTLNKLWMLRGWTMPRFGINSSTTSAKSQVTQDSFTKPTSNNPSLFFDPSLLNTQATGELLGSPPEVLYFSAYSNPKGSNSSSSSTSNQVVVTGAAFSGNLYKIPVVIQSLNIPYPTDVDYIISSQTKTAVPIIMAVDLTLLEAHSAQEYEQFSLDDYKSGTLRSF